MSNKDMQYIVLKVQAQELCKMHGSFFLYFAIIL